MKKWLQRIRGAVGMGLPHFVAWGALGGLVLGGLAVGGGILGAGDDPSPLAGTRVPSDPSLFAPPPEAHPEP